MIRLYLMGAIPCPEFVRVTLGYHG